MPYEPEDLSSKDQLLLNSKWHDGPFNSADSLRSADDDDDDDEYVLKFEKEMIIFTWGIPVLIFMFVHVLKIDNEYWAKKLKTDHFRNWM